MCPSALVVFPAVPVFSSTRSIHRQYLSVVSCQSFSQLVCQLSSVTQQHRWFTLGPLAPWHCRYRVYFRGVDVSPNFVSPSVSTDLSRTLNNVCVSNSVGMFVDNGGTLMSVPRGSFCMTGNVCMPTGVYLLEAWRIYHFPGGLLQCHDINWLHPSTRLPKQSTISSQ